MINLNGKICSATENHFSSNNRGFKFGDALFETLVVFCGKINFLEDHYFRLMKSMRIMRMEIPSNFTLDVFEKELLKTLDKSEFLTSSARVRITVFRTNGGRYYKPTSNEVEYLIECLPLTMNNYQFSSSFYEVDVFKDYPIAPNILSTIKTNNKAVNVLGSIYAEENKIDNCILINTDKHIVEALQANVFVVYGKVIKTPPLIDGCQDGIIRRQLNKPIFKELGYELEESHIRPFELQSADEVFLTNIVMGVQPVTKFRKKIFSTEVSKAMILFLNHLVKKSVE